jgi:putative pyruvate formate lyase activating enzyme
MALLTKPAYRNLSPDELAERAGLAVESLAACRACPRDCGVDRLADKWSACKTGRHAVVSSAFPHFGEEDCLRGWNGSGTIFFAHCNLRCVFCQNFDISQAVRPGTSVGARTAEEIGDIMLALQARGCHNINFVTPEHVVPQVLEAVACAVPRGLRLPLVYNTSAYDSLESLRWLDGVVDIYMPDLKVWSADSAGRYLKAEDYPEVARQALKEMHRQVGALHIDERGLATRGVLVRHLVMPGLLEETRECLRWLATELGPGTYVNLMDQYRPAGKVRRSAYAEIDRRISATEWSEACRVARSLDLRLDVRGGDA